MHFIIDLGPNSILGDEFREHRLIRPMASMTGVGDPGVSTAACISVHGHAALWLLSPEREKEDVWLHGSLPG